MIGSNLHRVVLTHRDRLLLEYAAEGKLLDREQIQRLAGFGSVNRANDRLLRLHSAGLLHRYFLGTVAGGRKSIYAISPKGAAAIGAEKFWKFQRAEDELLVGEAFVEHQLAVNWCWISAKFVPNSKLIRFVRFNEPIAPAIQLRPDGYAELEFSGGIQPVFFEIDLGNESSPVWDRKIELYLKLATTGEFARIFQQPRFKVAVVCTSERRLHNLRRIVRKHTLRVFYFSLLEIINHEGLSAPHWLRPEGDAQETLV